MKYTKFIFQFLIICFGVFLVVAHLIPNQLQNVLNQSEPSSLSLLLIPIVLLGSIFLPTFSLAFSDSQLISIAQITLVLAFTTIWVILFERIYKYIQTAREKGINSTKAYKLFLQTRKLFLVEIALYSLTNIISVIFLHSTSVDAANVEPAMIPYNSIANIIFAFPMHQIGLFLILLLIGIFYKNNVMLKKEQDLII